MDDNLSIKTKNNRATELGNGINYIESPLIPKPKQSNDYSSKYLNVPANAMSGRSKSKEN